MKKKKRNEINIEEKNNKKEKKENNKKFLFLDSVALHTRQLYEISLKFLYNSFF